MGAAVGRQNVRPALKTGRGGVLTAGVHKRHEMEVDVLLGRRRRGVAALARRAVRVLDVGRARRRRLEERAARGGVERARRREEAVEEGAGLCG